MMTVRRCVSILTRALALASASWIATPATAAAPSIADFAVQADVIAPALSPDGNLVAHVARVQNQRMLMVLDFSRRERRALMPAIVDSFEVRYCRFKTNANLLCALRGTEYLRGIPFPTTRLVSVDTSGKSKARVLVQNGDQGRSQYQDRIVDWQRGDPEHVLIALSGDGDPFPSIHRLNATSGHTLIAMHGQKSIMDWTADRNGVVRFGYGFDGSRHFYIVRDSADGDWRTLSRWEIGKADFKIVGFGGTPTSMLARAPHNGRDAIFDMDLAETRESGLLFAHDEVDVGDPIHWPVDDRIVGFEYETDRMQRKLLDPEAARIYGLLERALPGADNEIVGASDDGKRLLVISRADVRPSTWYLFDPASGKLGKIGSANPLLEAATLAPMKPVRIKAADGQVLPGYLTLPPDSDGKRLPTIVYPHGGPHSRDSWGFDPVVQFLASRGYAVVQVNFRGSTGYGTEWYRAGLRNWGTVMIDDVTASAKWAIAEGIADPQRTCIVGWSFGGYAALMSAARESGLYRCVVSIAGVSDLRALAEEWRNSYGGRDWAEYALGDDASELKAGSPTRSAAAIKAPVLLIHGDEDTQASVTQSRRMARALDAAKKKHEVVIIKDGNHSLSRFEWRETLYRKLEEFLAVNL
jgi:dipeptidyl aminopeptidase/acylaminoacyl peptidase